MSTRIICADCYHEHSGQQGFCECGCTYPYVSPTGNRDLDNLCRQESLELAAREWLHAHNIRHSHLSNTTMWIKLDMMYLGGIKQFLKDKGAQA